MIIRNWFRCFVSIKFVEYLAMPARLEALDHPKKAIAAFLDSTVANTVADLNHKGCFLLNTALEISRHGEK